MLRPLCFTDFNAHEESSKMRRSFLLLNSRLNLIDTLTSSIDSTAFKFCFFFFFLKITVGTATLGTNYGCNMSASFQSIWLYFETEKHKILVSCHPEVTSVVASYLRENLAPMKTSATRREHNSISAN